MFQVDQSSKRLFILDTNVLMHDPTALFRFQEHDVYLPMVVLEELDAGNHKAAHRALRDALSANQDSVHAQHVLALYQKNRGELKAAAAAYDGDIPAEMLQPAKGAKVKRLSNQPPSKLRPTHEPADRGTPPPGAAANHACPWRTAPLGPTSVTRPGRPGPRVLKRSRNSRACWHLLGGGLCSLGIRKGGGDRA